MQGRLIDGDGNGVNDGLIEIWQANAAGKYAHPEDQQKKPLEKGWRGFGRIPTDAKGAFRFTTIKPGRVPRPAAGCRGPHSWCPFLMRGMLKQLATRIYFPDEAAANAEDPDPAARSRSAARHPDTEEKGKALEWNIVLQGKNETVFLDYF